MVAGAEQPRAAIFVDLLERRRVVRTRSVESPIGRVQDIAHLEQDAEPIQLRSRLESIADLPIELIVRLDLIEREVGEQRYHFALESRSMAIGGPHLEAVLLVIAGEIVDPLGEARERSR